MVGGQAVDYNLESFDFGYAAIEGVTMYSVNFNRSTSDMRDLPLFFYSIISIHVFSSLCGFVYTVLDDVLRTPRFRSPSKFQPSLSFRVLDWLLLLGCFSPMPNDPFVWRSTHSNGMTFNGSKTQWAAQHLCWPRLEDSGLTGLVLGASIVVGIG